MSTKPSLSEIRIHEFSNQHVTGNRYEIQLEWDNGRRHGLGLASLSPERVLMALRVLAGMVGRDVRNRKL